MWWAAAIGYFAPICPLVCVAMAFIGLDFVFGCVASHKRITAAGRKWKFSSSAAWCTVYKAGFCVITITALHVLSVTVLHFVGAAKSLPNIFCAMVCATEMWSFLENAAEISESKIFTWLRRYTVAKVKKYDADIADAIEPKDQDHEKE